MAAGAYALHLPAVKSLLSVDNLRGSVREKGAFGPVFFIVLCAAANAFGFPRILVATAAGAIFGAAAGIPICQVAITISALANYWFARSVGRKRVMARFGKRIERWNRHLRENGFWTMLMIRLFPVGNATLTNLLAGVTALRSGPYVLASFLGFLPLTIIFALFGSSLGKHNPWQLTAGGLLLFALTAWCFWYRQRNKQLVPDDED